MKNGFKKLRKISGTLQGEIYEAVITDSYKKNKANLERVAIKRTSKNLHKTSVASQDSADLTVLVEEDIIKEAMILYVCIHVFAYVHCIQHSVFAIIYTANT